MDREGGGAAFCVFSVRSSFMLYRSFFPLLFSSLQCVYIKGEKERKKERTNEPTAKEKQIVTKESAVCQKKKKKKNDELITKPR